MRFVGLLNLMEQDPTHDWRAALGHAKEVEVTPSTSAEASSQPPPDDDDDLVTFKL